MALSQETGLPVRSLQTMLRLLSQADPSIPPVIPDGVYGTVTLRSVTAFQKKAGLPQTGTADLPTWQALTAEYRRAAVTHLAAAPLLPALQPAQVVRQGQTNHHLYLVQGMLQALSQVYTGMPSCSVTGRLDPACARCLRWFQEKAGLPATGDLDRHTWMVLAKVYRLAVQDGDPARCAARP